jgi:hypothetical protein
MHTLALTATVSGIDGFLWIVAALLFLVAAVIAWVSGARWATMISAGLLLWVLTNVIK